jgi:hypothetical protein
MRKHLIALAATAAAAFATSASALPEHRFETLRFAPSVQWIFDLERAAPEYVAAQRVEVRSDPEPDAIITGVLHRGELFRAAGRTGDGWVAVVRDGVIQGYVSEGVVAALSTPRAYAALR